MIISFGRRIVSESIYEGEVQTTKVEIERQHFTEYEQLLKDFLDSVRLLSDGSTHKLNIEICLDKQGRYKFTDRYEVKD